MEAISQSSTYLLPAVLDDIVHGLWPRRRRRLLRLLFLAVAIVALFRRVGGDRPAAQRGAAVGPAAVADSVLQIIQSCCEIIQDQEIVQN